MDPIVAVMTVAALVCAFCLTASLISGEHSWVDRLWSIVPVVYVWVFAAATALQDARLVVMAALVTLWGARLTFNFARKGGYTGTEDYRWAVLRARMKRWQFEIFNVLFIVLWQNAILVLISLAALTAYDNRETPFGLPDAIVAAAFLALLVGETVADQQQWNFHRAKATGSTTDRFLTSGLWRYSRHPNFFFEQAQWWVFFLFGAIAAGSLLQWTVAGPVVLTLLFIGSTRFTESITRSKYPEYAQYQATTSAIVPLPPRASHAASATI